MSDLVSEKMKTTVKLPGNGADLAKDVADYVTDTVDEDGLYNAMKYYKLI